jgi:hypothetical protein
MACSLFLTAAEGIHGLIDAHGRCAAVLLRVCDHLQHCRKAAFNPQNMICCLGQISIPELARELRHHGSSMT